MYVIDLKHIRWYSIDTMSCLNNLEFKHIRSRLAKQSRLFVFSVNSDNSNESLFGITTLVSLMSAAYLHAIKISIIL